MTHLLRTYARLTVRQQEIVRYVTHGHTNKEVAAQLCISKQVVADHLTVIYEELAIALPDCDKRPNRPVLIRHFALLFQAYPGLIPDNEPF